MVYIGQWREPDRRVHGAEAGGGNYLVQEKKRQEHMGKLGPWCNGGKSAN